MLKRILRETDDFLYLSSPDDAAWRTISEDRSRGSRYETDRLSALVAESERFKALQWRCDPMKRGVLYTYRKATPTWQDGDEIESDDPTPEQEDIERLDRENSHNKTLDKEDADKSDENANEPPAKLSAIAMNGHIDPSSDEPDVSKSGKILPAKSLMDELERCRAELSELKGLKESRQKRKKLIIYRVSENDNKVLDHWLDPPRWLFGEKQSKSLQGSLPLSNVDNYTERHPEISFIVYRTYMGSEEPSEATKSSAEEDGAKPLSWSTESISIVSDQLRHACEKVFERLPHKPAGSIQKKSQELDAPYLFIYHSRSSLEECAAEVGSTDLDEWNLLVDYILDTYREEYARVDALVSQKKITNAFINYLFKPNEHVVDCRGGIELGFLSTAWPRIASVDRRNLMAYSLEHNLGLTIAIDEKEGKDAKNDRTHTVWKFKAYRYKYEEDFYKNGENLMVVGQKNGDEAFHIHELNVYPLEFAEARVQALLKNRGEIFWRCRSKQYVSYNSPGEEDPSTFTGDRYMIDTKTYLKLHKSASSDMEPRVDEELRATLQNRDGPPQQPFLLLLPNEIKGYNLRTKKWVDLQVDRIIKVEWNETAFENLVIDHRTKDLIRALITNLLAAEKGTDLIGGKGNGLTMLLHGGPGTGKTFTAESVAEIAHKPLYRVTCGDIGTTPKEVETYLESVLYLGKIWNCVVLLDEADVFLEERSLHDLQRNALVSTFLRVLEYYNGILILTSNRVGRFDEAFRSRIQLALHYKKLAHEQRKQVWRNFFRRLEDLEGAKINSDNLMRHVEDLADHQMNGREIRNAITIARQLAIYRNQKLDYETLQDVVESTSMFDKYLLELNEGNSGDDIARELGMR